MTPPTQMFNSAMEGLNWQEKATVPSGPTEAGPTEALRFILGSESHVRFLSDVLGRRYLHCRTDEPRRFDELLSFDALDSVLGSYGLRSGDIRLVQLDREIKASDYGWRGGLVDPLRVARLFSEGATVVFGSLQDRHDPLRRLCARLAQEAGGRTQTNIYLTPRESQGFRVHWDTHDVFVLQVAGSKRWRIYGGGLKHPLPHQKFDPELHEHGGVETEFTLAAGETLYIPRGVMHAAETTEETSIHITLGLIAYSWADLLVDCVMEIAGRSPIWRANIPFGFGREAPSGFAGARAQFTELIRALPQEVDLETVLSARLDLVGSAQRPRAQDYLRQASQAADLSEEHVVECRPDLAYRLEAQNGRILVHSGRRQVDFPGAARPTLESVLGRGPARAGDIEDGLDWPSRRVVLTTLIREGLVIKRYPESRLNDLRAG